MIPRNQRLSPRDMLAHPHQILRFPWGIVRWRAQEKRGITVIIAKKVAKLAVDRHKVKRRFNTALQAVDLPDTVGVMVSVSSPGARGRGKQLEIWCAELKKRILETTYA